MSLRHPVVYKLTHMYMLVYKLTHMYTHLKMDVRHTNM